MSCVTRRRSSFAGFSGGDTRFRPVTTVRPRTQAAAAAVARRAALRLRLRPGLYQIGVRVRLETGRLSPPVHAFMRVVG